MNTSLIQVLDALLAAREAKNNAKDTWTAAMSDGADNQQQARSAFLQADDAFAQSAGQFGQFVSELRDNFCLELAVEALEPEMKDNFYRIIAELRFDHLIAPQRPTLEQLARCWRRAASMLDAARWMKDRIGLEFTQADVDTVLASGQEYRNPEAFNQAADCYRVVLAALPAQSDDVTERISNALHFTVRHLLSSYDRLSEQLQTVLESLQDSGTLGFELSEIEDMDIVNVIRGAAGMLVRQRQTQTETAPLTRPVTVVDAETETDEEVD